MKGGVAVASQRGLAEQAVDELRAERRETLRSLLPLTDEQCATRVPSEGRLQSVNQVLRAFTSHELDHFQHLVRLLEARGRHFTEAELLLMKAHAALAEFEVLVLSLTDEEIDAVGPNDGDWSARQVLAHVIGNEQKYRQRILSGLGGDSEPSDDAA